MPTDCSKRRIADLLSRNRGAHVNNAWPGPGLIRAGYPGGADAVPRTAARPPLEGLAVTNASANQTEPTKLTPATYERLVAELEDLTTRGRVEIAQQIEAARALGDLSENGDYHAAKDFQGKMESRVRQLQAMLKEVVIVDEAGAEDGSISLGSTVTLRYEGDDEDDTQRF